MDNAFSASSYSQSPLSLRAKLCRQVLKRFIKSVPSPTKPITDQRLYLERVAKLAHIRKLKNIEIRNTQIAGMNANWIGKSEHYNQNQVILYFHGGGFIIGSKKTHRDLAARIAIESNCKVLIIDYRLAPEYPFPAANDDCMSAYKALLEKGYDPNDIILGGDSAGGFFVLQTLLAIKTTGLTQPKAAFLISPLCDALHFDGESYQSRKHLDPWLDMTTIADLVNIYIGAVEDKPSYLSPINEDLSGLPPLLIQVGEHEVLFSDSERLSEVAKGHNVDAHLQSFDEMWHVFHSFAVILPQAQLAIRQIGSFVRGHFS